MRVKKFFDVKTLTHSEGELPKNEDIVERFLDPPSGKIYFKMEKDIKTEYLFKALSMYLPYGVKVQFYGAEEEQMCFDTVDGLYADNKTVVVGQYDLDVMKVKPYLRSLYSMTKDEFKLFSRQFSETVYFSYDDKKGCVWSECKCLTFSELSWLLRHHFDVFGLIDCDLAIEVTKDCDPYNV